MLTVLFLLNLMVGALIVARGRELRRKADPSLLTGPVKNMVSDPKAYTKAVGTIEFAFGVIIIVLAGVGLTMSDWVTLLIGDVLVVVVYVAALYLLKRHFS